MPRHLNEWKKPYQSKNCDRNTAPHCKHNRRREQGLFFRFAFIFGAIPLFIIAGLALIYFTIGMPHREFANPGIFRFGGFILAIIMLVGFLRFVRRGSRRITSPLSELMDAADAVANGDLSVRVREFHHGEFSRLTQSFNNMATQLEQVDEQRKNMTADIAHELRTPLHILQGNLEGILDGIYEADDAHIQILLEEIRMLSRLVEDLQTISLAEGGQLSLRKEPIDPVELIEDLQTSFSGQAETAHIQLKTIIPVDIPQREIMADIERLQQVCSNLIANAIHHTPAGGIISLEYHPIFNGIQILIKDTGKGIAPDQLPYIFKRFWRGDPARKHAKYAGSGLGLAISKQLIEAHGGKISVKSNPGKGSIFTIELYQEEDSANK
ncbi:MAG: HAMP domain-containing histidine kinase [Anaerolineaceae bacterium]|nr:HAMP domain-containing histidine kinase [Anaerolineaceae bacterium]